MVNAKLTKRPFELRPTEAVILILLVYLYNFGRHLITFYLDNVSTSLISIEWLASRGFNHCKTARTSKVNFP